MVAGTLDLVNGYCFHECFYDDAKILKGKESPSSIPTSFFWRKVLWHPTNHCPQKVPEFT